MGWLDEMLKKKNETKEKELKEKELKEKEIRDKIIDEYKKSDEFKNDVVEIVSNEWHANNDDRTDTRKDENEIDSKKLKGTAAKAPSNSIKDAEKTMKVKEKKDGK